MELGHDYIDYIDDCGTTIMSIFLFILQFNIRAVDFIIYELIPTILYAIFEMYKRIFLENPLFYGDREIYFHLQMNIQC